MSPRAERSGARERRFWLFKSEPDVFSFEDLLRAPGRRTLWDGVRNHQARNFLRDDVARGDGVLFYHSSVEPPGIAGIARVSKAALADPTQFDPADDHHDPRSSREAPRWFAVEVEAVQALPRFLTLAEVRAEPRLAGMELLRRGSRLSIQPVLPAHWRVLLARAGLDPSAGA